MNGVQLTTSQRSTQLLPDEDLFNIFSYLHFRDLIRCVPVNKQWLAVARDLTHREPNPRLTKIVYDIGLKTSFDSLDPFQKAILEKSQSLDLSEKIKYECLLGLPTTVPPSQKVDSEKLATLKALPNLKKLNLKNSRIIGEALQHLHGLPITSLDLGWCEFSNLKPLESHPTLKELDLTSAYIDDFKNLCGRSIETLNLCSHNISGEALSQIIMNFPKLTTLHLANCRNSHLYFDENLLGLKGASIKTLNLSCCDISNNSLKNLQGLALERLVLNGCDRIDDVGIQNLHGLPLTSLDISFCKKITDQGLKCLQYFERLSDLCLNACEGITDDGFLNLTGLPIKTLSLKWCFQLSDQALNNCRGLPLETLNIFACERITDAGLKYLVGQSIKKLDVRRCRRVTLKGIGYLQKHSRTLIRVRSYRISERHEFSSIPNLKFQQNNPTDIH